jgi:hypothetical protein
MRINKMKKKGYFVFLMIVLFSTSAGAQIGIKLGMNINQMKYSNISDGSLENPVTFQIGAFYTWKLSRKFFLQTELFYSRSGAKRSISFPDSTITISEEFSYIKLPLLAKWMLLSKGNWSLVPLCGLYGAYNLTANQKVSYGDNEYSDSIRELIKPIDLGLITGFEIGYKTGIGTLFLDFRFSLGLSNTNKKNYSSDKAYNRMIVIQLGYQFGK